MMCIATQIGYFIPSFLAAWRTPDSPPMVITKMMLKPNKQPKPNKLPKPYKLLIQVFFYTAASMAVLPSASATTYRWVDEHGKVQYSDVKPPNHAAQGHKELDKQGRTVKEVQHNRMTPEAQKNQAEAAARLAQEKRQQRERHRRDMALLSTYTHENEIALTRDRALELENLNVRGLQTRMDRAAEKLAKANTQLAASRTAGKPEPASIIQMRNEAQRDLALISESMNQRNRAIENIHKRFEDDRARFLELKAMQ
jgi:hypothetical protein